MFGVLVGKSSSVVPRLTTDPKRSCLKLVLVVSKFKRPSKTVKDVRFCSLACLQGCACKHAYSLPLFVWVLGGDTFLGQIVWRQDSYHLAYKRCGNARNLGELFPSNSLLMGPSGIQYSMPTPLNKLIEQYIETYTKRISMSRADY